MYNKHFHSLPYRPDFKLNESTALNVDGLYWHSEHWKEKDYHFKMRESFEERNLRILQFRGDEVRNKLPIVKSVINNVLGKTAEKVYARKCAIKSVQHSKAREFLESNHLMGSSNSRHLGLYFGTDLVMILSYTVRSSTLKVTRLCSRVGVSVPGGVSKLLSHLEKNLSLSEIQYWVDLRYGTGSFLHKKLDFKYERDTLGWKWTDGQNTYNRLQCRANMDDRCLSEAEHAEELGWYKIYDAGQRLYTKYL